MYAKLKTLGKDGGYDVIAPTSLFLCPKMAREGM
ncbi:PotD, partial [Pasteurella multocida subsp. multocida str. Anand1_cattle]